MQNVAELMEDGAICPLFSSPPRGIWQLKSPHPWEFAIQGKKNVNARGSARGGGGGGGVVVGAGHRWNWLMRKFKYIHKKNALKSIITFVKSHLLRD